MEGVLQLGGTAAIQCDLKKDAIVRPMYAEILSIEWLAHLRVFRDYLKSVMFRNIEDIHQGLVKDVADLSTVLFDSPRGLPPLLEPQRVKGLKVQDVTRVFWLRGTRSW